MSIKYRPEIDGLRAIAVFSVIIYHAEFAFQNTKFLTGGYLGVDIFFVISGFLISKIIIKEFESTGKFSFSNFYERRARRILPMIFFVVFASLPFAWFLLLPTELVEYAKSIISSVFFSSNIFFYFTTTEYGATSSLLKPFLHTWSLSIEEQFYLFFPLIVIAIQKVTKRFLLTIFILLAIFSLQFSEFMSVRDADLNFYLLPSRAWQLLVGSILAYMDLRQISLKSNLLNLSMPLIGLITLVTSIVMFNHDTHHPGYVTLIPIIGTALIIHFGGRSKDIITRILSSQGFIFIGLISYSLYLWHFPIFAFMRVHYSEVTNMNKILAIIFTLILSYFSYKFIETPFRKKGIISTKNLIISLSSTTVFILIIMGLLIAGKGDFGRFKMTESYFINLDNGSLKDKSNAYEIPRNFKTNDGSYINVHILGNSHSEGIYKAFTLNKDLFPEFDFAIRRNQLSCYVNGNEAIFSKPDYVFADIIIISTRYAVRRCNKKDLKEEPKDDVEGLQFIIDGAKRDGKIIALMPNHLEVKDYDGEIFVDRFKKEFGKVENTKEAKEFSKLVNTFMYENKYTARSYASTSRERIRKVAEENDILFLDKEDYACNNANKECFALTDDFKKTIYDYGHYTLDGAKFYGQRIYELGWLEKLKKQHEDLRALEEERKE